MKIPYLALRFRKVSDSLKFGLAAGACTAVLMIAPGLGAQSGGARDCDANAVIRCGTLSVSELKQKYRGQQDVKVIFNHFGISSQEINRMSAENTQHGHVTRDGKVVVDGKTVATGATTAGRQNMPGSRQVSKNGTTFYTRPPSASFQQSRLDALVTMKDGRFQHAVLTSCGNPVKAKPVPQPKPQPKPVTREKPVEKPPKPQPVVKQQQIVQQQAQAQSQQVVVQQQPPAQTPPPPPAPPAPAPVPEAPPPAPSGKEEAPAQPTVLPDTGPGEVLGLSALVTFGSTFWYAVYARLRELLL